MEGISHLVSASLARHGFITQLDHRRLQWSKWCRCESSFSVLLVPSKPGLFALAEETTLRGNSVPEKRTLTLFRIAEAKDLGMALGRLFLPNTPERELLLRKPCFFRYAVIEDADQRLASYHSLQEWMVSASSASSGGISDNLTVHSFVKENGEDETNESSLARTGT